jgi:hypothetical protein
MDFTKDQNPTALFEVGIKAGESLPHYVKEASLLQEEDLASLHDCAFADPVNRLHPIHTKSATYMSAVYLAGEGKLNSPEFEAIKEAAALFDIEKDIEDAIALLPQVEKSATNLYEDKYALNFQIEEEDSWQAYPINNDVEVTKAATEAVRDWNEGHIPTDWFFHAAKQIVKRANELGISRNEIPDRVWNMGEERMVNFENAEFAISERQYAGANTEEYQTALKQASEGKISVDEAIDTWMTLDVVNNINHKRITSPQEAFYSGMKLASVEALSSDNVFISDVMVPLSAVEKLLTQDGKAVKMAFRKETADRILSVVKEASNKTAKTAAVIGARLSELSQAQQKELLNVLLKVA